MDLWFSLSVRRNRKSFVLAFTGLYAFLVCVALVLGSLGVPQRVFYAIMIVFAIPTAVVTYTLSGQRLRDIGVTGWLALLWIPLGMLPDPFGAALALAFTIVLVFVPGTQGDNRYGPDPLESW
jgi:uncharacterized membrane protein YhaH (DUF805 family)